MFERASPQPTLSTGRDIASRSLVFSSHTGAGLRESRQLLKRAVQ